MISQQKWIQLGDMALGFLQKEESGQVEMSLVPWSRRSSLAKKRGQVPLDSVEMRGLPESMRNSIPQARKRLESPVQLKLRGDRCPGGWQGGMTLRGSPEQHDLRFLHKTEDRDKQGARVTLSFERIGVIRATQTVEWQRGEQGLRVYSSVENISKSGACLEMISSFYLGGLSPFAEDDATGRLFLQRYRSNWSNEGRPVAESLEELSLERSWAGSGVRTERFGNVGSFPVNQWFPHAAIEDRGAGVTWAVQLCHNGSWQMELQRLGDQVSLSGGLADRLKGSDVRYLVIDAGWTARPHCGAGAGGQAGNGDWLVDRIKFPQGLRAAADAIRARGLIPGLWFEFEVTTEGALVFEETAHQLHLDDYPVDMAGRRFWDFRDPWVRRYLRKKVIRQLKEGGFGYLKVDYNNTIGLGCDGAESPGEGLRQHLQAVQDFFREIRRELPDLIIENCASGGHRLEPSMQALCAMGPFSDAHESNEIPIIAAQLHFQILPRQSQIWCTLRRQDDARRLYYSLAACLLGRMALSGDEYDLDPGQWAVVEEGMAFYQRAVPLIRSGHSRLFRSMAESYRHPEGWQALRRVNKNGQETLLVLHRFGGRSAGRIRLPLTEGEWKIEGRFGDPATSVDPEKGQLSFASLPPYSACSLLLKRS